MLLAGRQGQEPALLLGVKDSVASQLSELLLRRHRKRQRNRLRFFTRFTCRSADLGVSKNRMQGPWDSACTGVLVQRGWGCGANTADAARLGEGKRR